MNEKLIDSLRLVLDFVERYNKQDKEKDVAEAVEIIRQAYFDL